MTIEKKEKFLKRFGGRGFGRYAAIAAAVLLIAATGVLLHSMKNIQPDEVYPETEHAVPTEGQTEIQTEPVSDKDMISGSRFADNIDETWPLTVYIPEGPSSEDRSITFNLSDVKAVKDAVSECRFSWCNENRFADPRREEFMIGAVEIYPDGYIQESFSSDSRLLRVVDGDWDKVVTLLREQLNSDRSIEGEELTPDIILKLREEEEAVRAAEEEASKAAAEEEKARRAKERAARSYPSSGKVSGQLVAKAFTGESTTAVMVTIDAGQGEGAVTFTVDDLNALSEAVKTCTFEWVDDTKVSDIQGREYYQICGLNIYPKGYIMDTVTGSSKLLGVTAGDWNRVTEILRQEISCDTEAGAQLILTMPEYLFNSMFADISVDLSFESYELYNMTGSGRIFFINNTSFGGDYDKEYIYISDPFSNFAGELITPVFPDPHEAEFYYTEKTRAPRVENSYCEWIVERVDNDFISTTSGSRFYNTPELEFRHIRRRASQAIADFSSAAGDSLVSSAVWLNDILNYNADYTDTDGVKHKLTLHIDNYGTPLLWEEYTGDKRTFYYELSNVVYNENFVMPEPVLNKYNS